MSTAIIGAGAAGLSLALMLDDDVEVFEADDTPGGLCRSAHVDGFTFDQGPHILGGIPEAVEWVKESTGLEFVSGRTRNKTLINRFLSAHPMEYATDAYKYQGKMWKTSPNDLAQPGLSAQKNRKPGGVSEFDYPLLDGYQAITDSWASQLGEHLHLAQPRAVHQLNDFDRIVDTTPIHHEGVRYNTVVTIALGYEGEAPDLTAVYVPAWEWDFHRLSFPAAFSPHNAPEGHFAIQGEASFAPDVAVAENLRDELMFLAKDTFGLAEPMLSVAEVHPNAYPVPTLEAEAAVKEYQASLPENVWIHGRTGSHRYLNVDGVVAASMELARELNTQ